MKVKSKSPTISGIIDNKDNPISIDQHEGTTICSVELEITKEYDELIKHLTVELELLTTYIDKIGGFVGHIKAFVVEQGRSAMLSTTGENVNKKEYQNDVVQLRLNIIVLGVSKTDLYNKVSEMLNNLN